MKKTRRFVALLLAAVLALALFTACGAAEQPQSAIGKVYEDWFVEQINSKRPGKPVQKVDVKHSEMRTALAKISADRGDDHRRGRRARRGLDHHARRGGRRGGEVPPVPRRGLRRGLPPRQRHTFRRLLKVCLCSKGEGLVEG